MTDAVVAFAGVTKHYGTLTALKTIDLEARPGERVALLGHNGAGKTTLMKLVLGLTRPTAGTVRLFGADAGSAAGAARRRDVGFLPENISFQGAMSGHEVLRFYARLKGEPVARCEAILDRVGLSDAAGRPVRTYSKGMRQRLGLAQALLGTPRLLLLDEPTTGLDPALRRRFFEIVGALAEAGATVMLSSHVLTELELRTDRVVVMRRGEIAADGSLGDLRRDANLPVRIRLTVPSGLASAVAERVGTARPTLINDHAVELNCAPKDKVDVVRRILDLGIEIEDIDIAPPTLDDIYAFYRDHDRETSP